MTDLVSVVIEHRGGVPTPTSLELVAAARLIGNRVEAVTHGAEVPALSAVLGAHGVSTLWDLGDLGDALLAPRVAGAIAAQVAAGSGPDAVFIPASYDGRDVAARLSAKVDRPVLTNVVGIEADGDGFTTEHTLFGGTEVARARFTGSGPAICVIRPKSFTAAEVDGAPATVEPLAAPSPGATDGATVIARHVDERSGPSLDAAAVVVSGGRGLGAKENYALIERLATALGGAPGASRAIVDAGWVPYSHQVGQTGTIVKPDVYLAFGISGATQHLVGMKGAGRIVAVNTDEQAPIFEIADLGIVGDVKEILPKLLAVLEERASA